MITTLQPLYCLVLTWFKCFLDFQQMNEVQLRRKYVQALLEKVVLITNQLNTSFLTVGKSFYNRLCLERFWIVHYKNAFIFARIYRSSQNTKSGPTQVHGIWHRLAELLGRILCSGLKQYIWCANGAHWSVLANLRVRFCLTSLIKKNN